MPPILRDVAECGRPARTRRPSRPAACTAINRLLRRTGKLWQDDYFDRLMRNEKQFRTAIEYVINNPVKAGLVDWPFVQSYPRSFL